MGIQQAIIVKAPFIRPAPSMPATALPTMNIFDELATAERREPNSKRPKKTINVNGKKVS
jgi:hypothetical protein